MCGKDVLFRRTDKQFAEVCAKINNNNDNKNNDDKVRMIKNNDNVGEFIFLI